MPRARVSAQVHSPSVDVFIDLGHPFLNRTLDGFLKIGTVGVAHAAAQDIYTSLKKESVSKHDLQHMVKRMGKEGVQWGAVAGVYTGMQYGMERVRGKRDWKNALLGGALTGALLTFCDKSHSRDKMIEGAITGGAIATASELLRYLT
eukprot:c43230_g1_i1 orf=212-655(+)